MNTVRGIEIVIFSENGFFKDFLLTQEEACKKKGGMWHIFNSFLGCSTIFFCDDPARYFGTVKYRET